MTAIVPTKRGDTLKLLFRAKNRLGIAQPLTDCTARLQLRNQQGNRVFVNASSEPGGGLIIDAEAGTVALDVPFTETEQLAVQTCYADLEMTFSGIDRVSTETFQVKFGRDETRDLPE